MRYAREGERQKPDFEMDEWARGLDPEVGIRVFVNSVAVNSSPAVITPTNEIPEMDLITDAFYNRLFICVAFKLLLSLTCPFQ